MHATYMSWFFFFHDVIMMWRVMASIDVISNLKEKKKLYLVFYNFIFTFY